VVAATAAAGRLGGVAFRLSACPDVRRTCRALAPRLAGQPVTALGAIDVLALGRDLGVPVEKAGRLLIVQDALRNCLADWENGELPRAGQGA
jgi:hypothetical protein